MQAWDSQEKLVVKQNTSRNMTYTMHLWKKMKRGESHKRIYSTDNLHEPEGQVLVQGRQDTRAITKVWAEDDVELAMWLSWLP